VSKIDVKLEPSLKLANIENHCCHEITCSQTSLIKNQYICSGISKPNILGQLGIIQNDALPKMVMRQNFLIKHYAATESGCPSRNERIARTSVAYCRPSNNGIK
jgi:hypothetical protein